MDFWVPKNVIHHQNNKNSYKGGRIVAAVMALWLKIILMSSECNSMVRGGREKGWLLLQGTLHSVNNAATLDIFTECFQYKTYWCYEAMPISPQHQSHRRRRHHHHLQRGHLPPYRRSLGTWWGLPVFSPHCSQSPDDKTAILMNVKNCANNLLSGFSIWRRTREFQKSSLYLTPYVMQSCHSFVINSSQKWEC